MEINQDKIRKLTLPKVSDLSGQDVRQVKRINASNKGIEELDDISACVELDYLDLSKNSLTDVKGIFHCKSLVTLNVGSNQIQSLGDIWKLRKLSILNASHNHLTSTIFLDKLKNLKVLILNNNSISQLTNVIKLKMLNTLILSNNQIEEIDLSSLVNLRKLSLSHNKLRATPDLKHNVEVKDVRLNDNKIMAIRQDLHLNSRLQILDLGNNRLKSTEEIKVIFQLTELKNLNMRGNAVCDDSINEELSKLPKLQVFNSKRILQKKSGKRSRHTVTVNRNASDNTSRKNGDHGDAVLTDNSSAKLNRNFNEYAKKSKKIISLEGTGDSNYNGQNSQDDSRENQSSTTRKRKRSLAAAEVQELNITNNFNSKILKKLTAVDDDAIISPSIKKAKKATADDDTVSIENPRAKQFKKLKKEDELVESSKIIIKSKKFKMKNLKAAESGITASFTSSNSKMPETAKLEGNKLIKSASHKPKKISIGIENIEKDKSSDLYSDSEEKSKKSTKNRLRLTGNKTKASKNADLNVTSDTFETLKETDNKKSKAKLKKRCKVDAIKVEGNTSTTIDASPSIAISEGLKVRNQEKHTLTKVTKMDTPKSLDAKAKADILKPSKKRKAKGDIKSMAALSESNEDSIEKGDGNQQKKSLKLKKAKMHAKNSTTSSSVTNSNRSTNKEDRHAIDALLSARSGVIAIKKQHSEKLKKDKVVFDPNFLTESDKIGTGGIIKWD